MNPLISISFPGDPSPEVVASKQRLEELLLAGYRPQVKFFAIGLELAPPAGPSVQVSTHDTPSTG